MQKIFDAQQSTSQKKTFSPVKGDEAQIVERSNDNNGEAGEVNQDGGADETSRGSAENQQYPDSGSKKSSKMTEVVKSPKIKKPITRALLGKKARMAEMASGIGAGKQTEGSAGETKRTEDTGAIKRARVAEQVTAPDQAGLTIVTKDEPYQKEERHDKWRDAEVHSEPPGGAAGRRDPLLYSEVLRTHKKFDNDFEAFSVLPKHTASPILLDEERILLVLRKHIITLLPTIILALILLVVPFFLYNSAFYFNSLQGAERFFFWALWYLGTAGLLLQKHVIWFYNVYIITDERVIDVNFTSVLSSDISVAKIEDIQDHSIKTNGFLKTMLDYGTVFMQTSAEKNEFAFIDVPHPEKVNKLLGELIKEEEREKMEGRVN